MPLIETTNTAESGLAILFAAIDYHQSSNQASSLSPTSFNPPKRALNPTRRGANVDVKWIGEANLSRRQRKINRRSWERSNFRKNKKMATELALPAPLSYSVPSSPNSVHTAIVSVSSSDGPDHDDSSSIESSLTAPDDLITFDIDSTRNASVEACHTTMRSATTSQATSEQTMPTLRPIISFDPDQLAALLEQQQQRLYVSIQKTEHSRALLHGM